MSVDKDFQTDLLGPLLPKGLAIYSDLEITACVSNYNNLRLD